MISYLPWSKQTLSSVLESFVLGNMPILDLELSALCKHRIRYGGCVYCDSSAGVPHSDELTIEEVRLLVLSAQRDLDLQWIYGCGLGEPTDDRKFRALVEFAASRDIYTSVFTNGLNCTKEYLQFLYDHNVCLLIKCDSLNPNVFSRLLGTDDIRVAKSIYDAIETALDVGFGKLDVAGSSRLALSIVPTQYNKDDILEVVSFCKENNLFPLLGQLEYAGRGKDVFDALALSNDELMKIKRNVEEVLGQSYEIPICPAGISGMHITNIGECVVHQDTGLSCPWFDLYDPITVTLGNIRTVSIKELWASVREYRKKQLKRTLQWMNETEPDIFGGCGGCLLVSTYLDTVKNQMHIDIESVQNNNDAI